MSRRRRREEDVNDSEGEGLDEKPDEKSMNGSESDIDDDDLDVSEYESVDEEARHSIDEEFEEDDPGGEQPENDNEKVKEDQGKEHENIEIKRENEEVSETIRESGDGKEQSDNEQHKQEGNLEADNEEKERLRKEEEDPAFIPTKGAFFQHDMRSENQSKGRGRDRKIWDKGPVKWSHDMFVMEEQMPKSRDLLISLYGYDIREKGGPPSDVRRQRGRGRGFRGRGMGRGRGRGRPRPENFEREQEHTETNNNHSEGYQDEYPTLNEENNNRSSEIKHKSKSYYKKDYQPQNFRENRRPRKEQPYKNSENQYRDDRKTPEDKENTRKTDETKSSPEAQDTNENKSDEKFSDILQVINSQENKQSSAFTQNHNSRRNESHSKNYQTTFSNYQEAPKPRRYSSLRQRQTSSPVDKQMSSSSQYSHRPHDARYSNFAKPVQPTSQNTNFSKKPRTPNTSSLQNQAIREEPKTSLQTTTAIQQQLSHPSPPISSQIATMAATISNPLQQGMTFTSAAASAATQGAPPDPGLMQMPQMPLPYNPMLNPMYFDPATYQRMLRMMSQQMTQMTMDQLQPHIPPQIDTSGTAIPPEAQTIPPPTDMQMNPLIPPVSSQAISQGSLGSIMRPPPPPLNPPTYFTGPMGMNMGVPQQPFPYPPNLVAQQVGGVTYFNTPTQSPPAIPQPVPNQHQQASSRRNAAIPIMAPMGFNGPSME
ncbi:uncharacterized protein LOC120342158 [Styela clava]